MSRTKTRIAAVAGSCVLALAARRVVQLLDDNGTGSSSDSTQAATAPTVLGTATWTTWTRTSATTRPVT